MAERSAPMEPVHPGASARTSENRSLEVQEHRSFIALWSMVCG